MSKGHWTPEEDAILIGFVTKFDTDWPKVSEEWPTAFAPVSTCRTTKQIRERYQNKLDSGIAKEPWTRDEDAQVFAAQKSTGNNWKQNARVLPGRVLEGVKQPSLTLARRKQKALAQSCGVTANSQ
jgi:hypothetical protein